MKCVPGRRPGYGELFVEPGDRVALVNQVGEIVAGPDVVPDTGVITWQVLGPVSVRWVALDDGGRIVCSGETAEDFPTGACGTYQFFTTLPVPVGTRPKTAAR